MTLINELEKLASLHKSDALNDSEFAKAKMLVLANGMSARSSNSQGKDDFESLTLDSVSGPVTSIRTSADSESFKIFIHHSDHFPATVAGRELWCPLRFAVYRYGGSANGVTFPIATNYDSLLALAMISFSTGHRVSIKTTAYDAQSIVSVGLKPQPVFKLSLHKEGDPALED